MGRKLVMGFGMLLYLWANPGTAHHSSAMFDRARTTTVSGTVKEFQWTNPHCWIQLSVADGDKVREWSIEMGSQSVLYRTGWRRNTLQQGQRVTVVINPLRDGSASAGLFVSATDAAGIAIGPHTDSGQHL